MEQNRVGEQDFNLRGGKVHCRSSAEGTLVEPQDDERAGMREGVSPARRGGVWGKG